MSAPTAAGEVAPSILIVDGDIVSRHAIADYLRHCGYAVVEAATTDEAMTALGEPSLGVDVILCDASAIGSQTAFGLSTWVRANRPELEVRLAGSLEGTLDTAAELCENGPHLARPYEPQAVVSYIKQLRASRDRAEG
jgi:DNA-binding NtrC family response regulator